MARDFQTNLIIGGRLNPSLANAFSRAARMANQSAGSISNAGNVANKVIGKVGAIVSGLAIGEAIKKSVDLASSLVEVQNVVDTTFGDNTKKINQWSKTALNSFGLSELQAKQFAGTMGAMLKSSGLAGDQIVTMSTNLGGLAGDLASFYNLSQDNAWEKIRSGISGETEPLKQLGINMSVANLETFALSKGIKTSYEKMDQASQTALRYAYLMKVSKDAQGDFTKTQGGFANQSRLLTTNLSQLGAKLASGLLPTLTKLAQRANDFLKNPEKVAQLQSSFDKLGAVISNVLNFSVKVFDFVSNNWTMIAPIIWGIVGATVAWNAALKVSLIVETLSGLWATATILIGWLAEGESIATVAQIALNAAMTANPVGVVIMAIGALIAIIAALVMNWDKVSAAVSSVWNWFTNLIGKIPDLALALAGPIAPLLLLIKHFDKVVNAVKSAWDWLTKWNDAPIEQKDLNTGETKTVGIPSTVSLFAKGGIATKPSIFGEDGAEIAIPLRRNRRSFDLLNQAAGMLGVDRSGGGNVFNYSPVINGGSCAEIEPMLQSNFEQFKAWIEQYSQEKGALSF